MLAEDAKDILVQWLCAVHCIGIRIVNSCQILLEKIVITRSHISCISSVLFFLSHQGTNNLSDINS
jgi:hypothetical protein